MACTWFGEVPSSCSLTLLLGPAWVLLKYVLQTIFSGPVHRQSTHCGAERDHRQRALLSSASLPLFTSKRRRRASSASPDADALVSPPGPPEFLPPSPPPSPHFPPPPNVPRQMALPIRRSARGVASAARTMDLAPKENCERRRGVAEGVSVNLASRRSRRLDERDMHIEGDPDDLTGGMH